MERREESDVSVEVLMFYSDADARGIGRLMPMLSSRFRDEPIPEPLLRHIIESSDYDQLVARQRDRIIGSATLSLVYGVGMNRMAYLEDFVVDTEARGLGVGRKLFRGVAQWAAEREVALEFTSGDARQAAHGLYISEGATVRDTNVFRIEPRVE